MNYLTWLLSSGMIAVQTEAVDIAIGAPCSASDTCANHSSCMDIQYCDDDLNCYDLSNNGRDIIKYSDVKLTGNGLCMTKEGDGGTCNDSTNACLRGYCNDEKKCEYLCKDKGDCSPRHECVENIEYCDALYFDCDKEPQHALAIRYFTGVNGVCMMSLGVGEKCGIKDASMCSSGYCGASGLCEIPCNRFKSCGDDQICVESVEYCNSDYEECGAKNPEADNVLDIFDVLLYQFGSFGTCYTKRKENESCDEYTEACESQYCNEGLCVNLCTGRTGCSDGFSCVKDISYCDKNYERCQHEEHTGIGYNGAYKYDFAGPGEKGGCYPTDQLFCGEQEVCSSGFCGSNRACQETCTILDHCKEGLSCMTLEYCSDAQYKNCQKEQSIGFDRIKYSFVTKYGESGLCYETFETNHDCDENKACASGLCDDKNLCAFDDSICGGDADCPEGLKCILMEYCDDSYTSCGPTPSDGTHLKYSEYDSSGAGNAFCRFSVPLGEECNDKELACDSRFCDSVNGHCINRCKGTEKYCIELEGATCIEAPQYCDDAFENCVPNPNLFPDYQTLTYNVLENMDGECFVLGEDGEVCDGLTRGCKSGQCIEEEGKSDRICMTTCEVGTTTCDEKTCAAVEYCDDKFKHCSPSKKTDILKYDTKDKALKGYCYTIGETGDECSEFLFGCASGAYCVDGICQPKCSTNDPCGDGEMCVESIEYCDANHAGCSNTERDSYSLKYIEVAGPSDSGTCLVITGDGSCGFDSVCSSGFCSVNSECLINCTDDSDCYDVGLSCYDVTYCDKDYTHCDNEVDEGLSTIRYLRGTGFCYHVVSLGDECDSMNVCDTGFCGVNRRCEANVTVCSKDSVCTIQGEACRVTEYCDIDYDNCAIGSPTSLDMFTLHFREPEATEDGICQPLMKADQPCNDYGTACESGWGSSDGICVDHCKADEECNVDFYCVEAVTHCNDDYELCTSTEKKSDSTLQYHFGGPGICFEAHEDGDHCDENRVCKGGYCSPDNICVTLCDGDYECNQGLCMNKIEYRNRYGEESTKEDSFFAYYIFGGSGICATNSDMYESCDSKVNACKDGLACYDGYCVNPCFEDRQGDLQSECGFDERCVSSVLYCDDIYSSCESAFSQGLKSKKYIFDSGYGGCYKIGLGDKSCDLSSGEVCESGHCYEGACQSSCKEEKDCPSDFMCLSDVQYCDKNYKNCGDDSSNFVKYVRAEGNDGLCVPVVIPGSDCSASNACLSNYCNNGACVEEAKTCTKHKNCSGGKKCLVSESCDTTNSKWDCQIGNDTGFHYIDIDESSTQSGFCRYELPSGSHCDGNENACESGFCKVTDINTGESSCVNYCDGLLSCGGVDEGCYVVSHSTVDSVEKWETSPGDPGSCYKAGKNGEMCNADNGYSCESGLCVDGRCKVECNSTCNCVESIQYCDSVEFDNCEGDSKNFGSQFIEYTTTQTLKDGYCFESSQPGVACDDIQKGCASGFCVDGKCEVPCSNSHSCTGLSQICMIDVDYCLDSTFTNCKDTPTDWKDYVIRYKEGEPGVCLSITGSSCNDREVCDNGAYCDENMDCKANPCDLCNYDNQDCVSEILYCDENFEECNGVPGHDLVTIKYFTGESGSCYDLVDVGGECEATKYACRSGYCGSDKFCVDFAHSCISDHECQDGEVCRRNLMCDESFDHCSESADGVTINYDHDVSKGGLCSTLQNDFEACDAYEKSCISDWCSEEGICVVPCVAGVCSATGQKCVSEVVFCKGDYTECTDAVPPEIEVIEYIFGSDGICLDVKDHGDVCSEHIACNDGLHCRNGACVNPCNGTIDCEDGSVCVESIEYCTDDYKDCFDNNGGSYPVYAYNYGEFGACFEVIPDHDKNTCDDTSVACESETCVNGECVTLCVDGSCDQGLSCISSVNYCDDDFTNCNSSAQPSGIVAIKYEPAAGDTIGYCYEAGIRNTPCDEHHGCASGYCDSEKNCKEMCTEDSDCSGNDEVCLAEVQKCDDNFQFCGVAASAVPDNFYYVEGAGLCYPAVSVGERCTVNIACKSGSCKKGLCSDDVEIDCQNDQDCSGDMSCMVLKGCSGTSCGTYDPNQKYVTVRYESTGNGDRKCINKGGLGDPCDLHEQGCQDGHYCFDSVCTLLCEDSSSCMGESCVYDISDYPFIVDGFKKYDTEKNSHTYGKCFDMGQDGEPCDELNKGCTSGICGANSRCVTPCSDEWGLYCGRGQNCISSLEYCEEKEGECVTTVEVDVQYHFIKYIPGAGTCFVSNGTLDDCDELINGCASGTCNLDYGVCMG